MAVFGGLSELLTNTGIYGHSNLRTHPNIWTDRPYQSEAGTHLKQKELTDVNERKNIARSTRKLN